MPKRFLFNLTALSGSRLVVSLSQVLVLPVVARFLTKEDFGAVALAMTLVIFVNLVTDAGFSRSLIRQPRLDQAEWNSAFWLLAAVGTALALLVVVFAPLWAWLFELALLRDLLFALSVVPLFMSLTAVSGARLERDGRFPTLALIRACSAAAGLAVAVLLAVSGAGAWALVGQQVVLAGLQLALTFTASAFRPGLPRGFVPMGEHIRFGRDTIGVALLLTAQRQGPMMMIGYVMGAVPLSLYSMAQRFLNLPQMGLAAPFSQVVYVRMAAQRGMPGQLGSIYVGSMRLLGMIIFPPMAMLAAAGPPVFALVLSEPWREVGTLFALAAPGIALETSISSHGAMFQAAGRTDLRLRMVTEQSVLRLLFLAAALPFGLPAVALSISLFALAYTPRAWHFARRADAFSRRAAAAALAPSVLVAAFGWIAVQGLARAGAGSAFELIIYAGAALVLAWPLAVVAQLPVLRREMSVFGT